MKNDQGFPNWMVGNGITWTVTQGDFERRIPDDVTFVDGSSPEYGRQSRSAMVVLGGRMKVVGAPGGWGWTSVASGSDETGWINLVVNDSRSLAEALLWARGWDNERPPSAEEMMASALDAANSEVTFFDVIVEASRLRTDSSADEALLVLERTATAWEILFSRFEINRYRVGVDSLNMLMYGDKMQTYALLEDARFLQAVRAESRDITLTDVRIASALSRLRTMTWTLAPGNDVNKRCWSAIAGHIAIRPAMEDTYRRTAPDPRER